MDFDPGSLHTVEQITFVFSLNTWETVTIKRRLDGKAVDKDEAGRVWYRWCQIRPILMAVRRRAA